MRRNAVRRAIHRTEERIFPATRRGGDRMLAEHWARYRFIAARVRGRALDLGCGTGYGARELTLGGRLTEIVAVDRSREALELAETYFRHPLVTYHRRDLERRDWSQDLGIFDTVVAFEILEHLRIESSFWEGIRNLLCEGGVLWLSTPLGRGRGRPAADPFHVHQLRRSEVASLFRGGWDVRFYGQTGSWIEPWVAGRRYYTILARGCRR
jgi:2-polyprenyl-3-methyl-5-hydroxy-6-metoxy-1,4-benzoquinol methylase